MSAHLICVTSGGGLPIFNRCKGNAENLPFSIIGSLNGVHMFGKSQYLELLSTLTQDYAIVWKEFDESVVLIATASNSTTTILNKLLENVYNAMVLFVGVDEVKSHRNIERLKRELRVGYPVIDKLLDALDIGDVPSKISNDLISMAECVLSHENHLLQVAIDSYIEYIDSMFCCLLIHGKIAVATENWWSLDSKELKLLSLLAIAENTNISKDIPVFLPVRSPNVAFRFVAISIMPNVQLCSLCGPTPLLPEIEQMALQCFKSYMENLNGAVLNSPKNFPVSLQLENGILGVLLINCEVGKYMASKYPQQVTNSKKNNNSHRLDILRTFYYQSVLGNLIEEKDSKEAENMNILQEENSLELLEALETYWCSEYHKCHALRVKNDVICVLYNSWVPNHAMRLISEKSMKILTADKQICW